MGGHQRHSSGPDPNLFQRRKVRRLGARIGLGEVEHLPQPKTAPLRALDELLALHPGDQRQVGRVSALDFLERPALAVYEVELAQRSDRRGLVFLDRYGQRSGESPRGTDLVDPGMSSDRPLDGAGLQLEKILADLQACEAKELRLLCVVKPLEAHLLETKLRSAMRPEIEAVSAQPDRGDGPTREQAPQQHAGKSCQSSLDPRRLRGRVRPPAITVLLWAPVPSTPRMLDAVGFSLVFFAIPL